MTRFRASILATTLLAVYGSAAAQPDSLPAIPLGYVGTDARVGVSIDGKGRIQGEALGVFGHDGRRSWLLEGWLGRGGAGGLLGSRQWLFGNPSPADTIDRPEQVSVAKAFLAADRNRFGDRKLTLGGGLERESYALAMYLSKSLSDERQVGRITRTTTETINGDEGGRPYRQTLTIDALVEHFERPYEHGVGLRLTRSYQAGLVKATAGLDYEVGRAMLAGRQARQLALTLGLEKRFGDSGHGVGVSLQRLSKRGPFDAPRFGGQRDDTRIGLRWTYEFGHGWQPSQQLREHRVVRTLPAPPPPPEVRRTVIKLEAATLFALDSAQVNAQGREALRPIVEQLKNKRVGRITIVGHTCDLGSESYNQALSERRAAAVASLLAAEGVPTEALLHSGRGESEPEHPNDSEDNRARNRRVVLSFDGIEEQQVAVKAPEPQTVTDIVRETVRLPAPWIQRALRTPPLHKREVDFYRIERVTETRTLGPREYLNRAPLANDDQATVRNGQPVTVHVLANDSEPDGQALTVTITSPAGRGTATVNADGSVSYTPGSSFVDSDSFQYTATDTQGAAATATVTITRAANAAPIAVDDTASSTDSDAVTVNVLANDSDPDGDTLTVSIARPPSEGQAVLNADRTITYRPDPSGSALVVTFEYRITDPSGLSDTATVTWTYGSGPSLRRLPTARRR